MPNGMNDQIPQHIAVIVDGNRRWAKERGLPVWQGHLQALDTVEQLVSWCNDAGVKYLTTYLFSTENWSRAEEELAHMFGDVFKKALGEYFPRLVQRNVKVQVLGELTRFPEAMRQGIQQVVERTAGYSGLVWNLCLDYGGGAELVRAMRQIVREQ